MKIKKLNKTHNVFKAGHAKWQAVFNTSEGYAEAIVRMYESFGPGTPYMNSISDDADHAWMFRNRDCAVLNSSNHNHLLYLTTEEQITFLTMSFKQDD